MEHLTPAQFDGLPVSPYDTIRPLLQDGDLLLAHGTEAFSKAIEDHLDSPWSHAGILFHWANRIVVVESVEIGTKVTALSRYLTGAEQCLVARFAAKLDIPKMLDAAVDALDRPYNWLEILGAMLRLRLGLGHHHPTDTSFVCSEMAAYLLKAGGHEIQPDDGGYITPETLWLAADLCVARIV